MKLRFFESLEDPSRISSVREFEFVACIACYGFKIEISLLLLNYEDNVYFSIFNLEKIHKCFTKYLKIYKIKYILFYM